jgi:hypothetical protein
MKRLEHPAFGRGVVPPGQFTEWAAELAARPDADRMAVRGHHSSDPLSAANGYTAELYASAAQLAMLTDAAREKAERDGYAAPTLRPLAAFVRSAR